MSRKRSFPASFWLRKRGSKPMPTRPTEICSWTKLQKPMLSPAWKLGQMTFAARMVPRPATWMRGNCFTCNQEAFPLASPNSFWCSDFLRRSLENSITRNWPIRFGNWFRKNSPVIYNCKYERRKSLKSRR